MLKKYQFLWLLFLPVCPVLSAQQQLVSTSGGSFAQNQIQLDFSLGETVTATLTQSPYILSQGFHQPGTVQHTSVSAISVDWKLYPNPAQDFLLWTRSGAEAAAYFEIMDSSGRVLLSGWAFDPEFTIDITHLMNGIYIFQNKNFRQIFIKS